MQTTSLVRLAAIALCGVSLAAQSPEERAAARALMARRGDAIVTLLGTMKTRMAMNGREMSASEARLQTNATVLDSHGLAVVSLTAIEPDNLFGGLFAQEAEASGAPPMKVETKSETTDLRLRFADGKEVPVKIVLRDTDLDLAFVKPIEPLAAPVAWVDGPSAKPGTLDLLVGLERLGEMAGWKLGATFSYVVAVIDKPRTAYLGGTGLGGAVFDTAGQFVGIGVISTKNRGATSSMSFTSAMSGMSGLDSMGMLPIVMPADDIREIAKQAIGK